MLPRVGTFQAFSGSSQLGVQAAGFDLVHIVDTGKPAHMVQINDSFFPFAHFADDPVTMPFDIDLLYGNPACAGFSNQNQSHRGPDSPANEGLHRFFNLAADIRPAVVMAESVTGLFKNGQGLIRQWWDALGSDYHLTHLLHSNASSGGAQLRRRYMVMFSVDKPMYVDRGVGRPVSISERLAGIEHDDMGTPHEPGNMSKWINAWDAVKPGDSLRKADPTIFASKRRAHPDRLAPAVTGQIETMHWDEPRFLTAYESALLMGMPHNWRLPPEWSQAATQTVLGQAVPYESAEWAGSVALATLYRRGEEILRIDNDSRKKEHMLNVTNHFIQPHKRGML